VWSFAVTARPVAQLGSEGTRVTLASVRDGYVALPFAGRLGEPRRFPPGGRAGLLGWQRPGAEQDGPAHRALRPILIMAGCDPALPLLEAPLGLLDPPVGFSWWPCPSREALRLAAAGLVHGTR
jgi:hypothetical protein